MEMKIFKSYLILFNELADMAERKRNKDLANNIEQRSCLYNKKIVETDIELKTRLLKGF
jgi:hypothetical protein